MYGICLGIQSKAANYHYIQYITISMIIGGKFCQKSTISGGATQSLTTVFPGQLSDSINQLSDWANQLSDSINQLSDMIGYDAVNT